MDVETAIKVEGLRHRFKDHEAVAGVSFRVPARAIHGFVGPNGAGKTTTLKIVGTLLAPQTGVVEVFGEDVARKVKRVRRQIGYMPDHFAMYKQMTVFEYLDFFAAAYGQSVRKRNGTIDDVLQLTDMSQRADSMIKGLSRGMQQRISLARVLVHDPKLLLLDEPASGLDPRARIEMKELLKALCSMGKTILISSHILSELGDMCNKIGILEHGELLASGEVGEIMARVREVQELRIEVFEGADEAEAVFRESPGLTDLERAGNEFQMQSRLGRAELAALHSRLQAAGVKLLFFEQDKGSLEDVFLSVTKGGI